MSTFGDYKSYKKYEPAYASWKNRQDIQESKRIAYIKQNPNEISKEDIPIESQIILIIDSYFALLENRPYREAMSKEEALNLIKEESNKKWSDKLVHEFISLIRNDV